MIQLHTPQGVIEVDPCTITDAELADLGLTRVWADKECYQEQLAQEFNDVHEQAVLALKNWSSLTLAQKDTILKNLLKWALWKDGWLQLGTL